MWIALPYTKAPADQDILPFRYDWIINNPLYAGYALGTYTFLVLDANGLDRSASMIQGAPTNDSKFLYVTVKGGTHPNDYYLKAQITFTKTGAPNFVKEWEVLIQVRQEGL